MSDTQEVPGADPKVEERLDALEGSMDQLLQMMKTLIKEKSPIEDVQIPAPAPPVNPNACSSSHIEMGEPADKTPPMETPAENTPQPVVIPIPPKHPRWSADYVHDDEASIEQSKVLDKMQYLEEKLRVMEGLNAYGSVGVEDLCMFSDVFIPPKFKVPEFVKYAGTGCPKVHLSMYCQSMTSHKNNEKLLVHCFQNSLSGTALSWFLRLDKGHIRNWRDLADTFIKHYRYNTDIAPDRDELRRMEKKDSESFREYAQRYRDLASQIQPPLTDREIVTTFISTLKGHLYDKLIGTVSMNFHDVVQTGSQVEDAIKMGKLTVVAGDSSKKPWFPKKDKKEGETNMISRHPQPGPYYPSNQFNQTLSHYPTPPYHQYAPQYMPPPYPYPPSLIQTQGNPAVNAATSVNPTRSNLVPQQERMVIDPVPLPYKDIFKSLIERNQITPQAPVPISNPPPRWYNPSETCEYHMGAPGHSTEKCWQLKRQVQRLRNDGLLEFEPEKPNVQNNPLPTHKA